MLIAVVVIGFAIVVFQLSAQRVLLVQQVKHLMVISVMIEQLDGVDVSYAKEAMQRKIDIAAGREPIS